MPRPASLAQAFERYVDEHRGVARFCVAYSGGRDSHVLLHLAASCLAQETGVALRALHIDHGLAADSATWAAHCRQVCERLGVAIEVVRVDVRNKGEGPEAAARDARYAAFRAALGHDEYLLMGQHADDQAETFLLHALRGSGPDGLAGMPAHRPFGHGVMARPLIKCPHEAIVAHAEQHGLRWIEDPSNASRSFDRNFLRHEIMPRLRRRWPAAVHTFGRSASRSAAASRILRDVAEEDLSAVRLAGTAELSVAQLQQLPHERACNALRLWIRLAGRRLPRLQDLGAVFDQLIHAGPASGGFVGIGDYEVRRYRDRLYLLPALAPVVAFKHDWPAPYEPLLIEQIGLRITREDCAAQGLVLPGNGRVTVRSRIGGESLRAGDPPFTKSVKKLLQEAGVPPWERYRIPLLFVDQQLAAVWNIAVAGDFQQLGAEASAGWFC